MKRVLCLILCLSMILPFMNVFAPKAYADELPDGNTEDNQD